jgi:hypothetical protein
VVHHVHITPLYIERYFHETKPQCNVLWLRLLAPGGGEAQIVAAPRVVAYALACCFTLLRARARALYRVRRASPIRFLADDQLAFMHGEQEFRAIVAPKPDGSDAM